MCCTVGHTVNVPHRRCMVNVPHGRPHGKGAAQSLCRTVNVPHGKCAAQKVPHSKCAAQKVPMAQDARFARTVEDDYSVYSLWFGAVRANV
jgi:hypothetical protein